ncbi:hypothetical protein HOP51_09500 [Halomonas sp. MCCC 1A11036]|uniref:DUF112 domain-containing protein n=1 Tax=Billgrantia zhangzhouensis TaxID=2733481 RepID=A0ABS9AF23_9GAMM|nr:tripartite tricarboxylate transporter permease [Halomonas zhangzhouensis]MCE8020338.1 hypothetical protein [Halomonas zhangzhouensis]
MHDLAAGLQLILSIETLLWIAAGSILGIVLGALPGLSATMGVALMLPVSFHLPTATGVAMLLAVYAGAVAGASIPAILLGTPGNPNAIATIADGLKMAKQGRAGLALGSAALASLIGGLFSLIVLMSFAPLLARATLLFGPVEKFGLALLGLTLIASISGGQVVRGMAMAAFGILLALLGSDPYTNAPRMPFPEIFARTPLHNGIELIPALIGLFGVSQALVDLERLKAPRPAVPALRLRNLFPSAARLKRMWRVLLESSGIGTLVGMLPGAGASIAVFLAYDRARALTHTPDSGLESTGSGSVEGVMAPESANNAVTGGAMVPVLTLGIPGDAATAVVLGALMIQGVVPGNELFMHNMPLVYAIFIGMAFALVAMFAFQLIGVRLFPHILRVPLSLLIPLVLLLSLVGTFAVDGQAVTKATYNMGVALAMGLIGYAIKKAGYPLVPLVLGLILGAMLEDNYRLAVKLARGDQWVFFQSPILLGMLALIALILFLPRLKRAGILRGARP